MPGEPRVQPIDKRIELFDQRIHAAVEASRKGFDASDQLRDNQQEQSRDQRNDNCVGQKQGKRAPQGCRADAIKGSPLKDAEKRIDEVSDAKTEQNRREDVQHPCKKTVDGAQVGKRDNQKENNGVNDDPCHQPFVGILLLVFVHARHLPLFFRSPYIVYHFPAFVKPFHRILTIY